MSKQWDQVKQFHLFLAILEVQDVRVVKWDEIAEKMTAKGYPLSKEACRQHFQKLKRETKEATANPGTPGSTGKRKRTKNVEADGGDDDEFLRTPSKVKRETKNEEKEKKEEEDPLDWAGFKEQNSVKIEDDDEAYDEVFDLEHPDIN